MDIVYSYGARTKIGKIVEGLVIAANASDAERRIREIGHDPIDVQIEPGATVEVMLSQEMNKRELGRFYITLGKRLGHGANVVLGLEQAVDFVTDPRLKTMLGIMASAIRDGARIADAMAVAGLPLRDAATVRALEQSGNLPDAFIAIGEECLREFTLRREMRSLVRTPMAFLGLVYVFTYVVLVLAVPKVKAFLDQLPNLTLPPFASAFYSLADAFNKNLVVSTVVYLVLGVLLVMFARSSVAKRLVYRVPLFNRLSTRSDMAALWSGYAMLYNAGVNIGEAARMMAAAAQRDDSRESFNALANALQTGVPLDVATLRAGFPDFVSKGITAAASSGEVHSGIQMLAGDLAEDVTMLTTQLKQWVQNAMPILMGVILAGFFMVTLYPIMSAVLSRV